MVRLPVKTACDHTSVREAVGITMVSATAHVPVVSVVALPVLMVRAAIVSTAPTLTAPALVVRARDPAAAPVTAPVSRVPVAVAAVSVPALTTTDPALNVALLDLTKGEHTPT